MVEPVSDNILNLVNELYNNLDAKDKIINEQALEIARLQQRYNALLEAHKIQEELLEDKENKIDKAIEYIKERFDKDKGIWIIDCYELLEILGDKENE